MATKQELEKKLLDLQEALDSVPAEFKQDIQDEIDLTQSELEAMKSSGKTAKPTPVKKAKDSDEDPLMSSILSTLSTIMESGNGSVDTPEVRKIIKDYLVKDKIQLSELDASILEEFRKNQEITLKIPEFAKEITVDSSTAQLPNFYEIIDDVLAGNNVYLIGEAGGGKTYTAEQISKVLGRTSVTLNCSQYTSPLEILGGQSIEGFKEGKLIDCWKNGKILILDEMPKLDPNTAGLLNDALAKNTRTTEKENAKINSANTEEPPIERSSNFGIIATGNIYPNEPPKPQYRGNNQQDLSLLDRFSGSVYYTEFSQPTDAKTTRYEFLYKFLVGNYYEYISAKKEGSKMPDPKGLRTIIESNNLKNLALVSYRTNTSFRVAFEYELVREYARREGKDVIRQGKTVSNTFKSYMVAFMSGGTYGDTYDKLIKATDYTESYINGIVKEAIDKILSGKEGFIGSLNEDLRSGASSAFERYEEFFVGDVKVVSPTSEIVTIKK